MADSVLTKKQQSKLERICNDQETINKANTDSAFYYAFLLYHKNSTQSGRKLTLEQMHQRAKDILLDKYTQPECAERWGLKTRAAASAFIINIGLNEFYNKKREEKNKKRHKHFKKLYIMSKGVPNIAAEHSKLKAETIANYWRKQGWKVKSHFLSPSEIVTILACHDVCDGNATRVEKDWGFKSSTVLRYWKKAGYKTRKPGGQRKN